MIALAQTDLSEEFRAGEFSADLSSSIGKQALLQIVLETSQQIPERQLRSVYGVDDGPRMSARVLLVLLTYCYAIGVYRSKQIEQTMGGADDILDPPARPPFNLIRRFRLKNRELLARCLERVCLRVCQVRVADFGATFAPGPENPEDNRMLQMQVTCDVNDRLNRADRLDYWDLFANGKNRGVVESCARELDECTSSR